jgi:acetyltransferase-like isoleucine patch superfamily enzyme
MRNLYLSPFGFIFSIIQNMLKIFTTPFMVYGYFDRSIFNYRKHTRISSSACLSDKKNIEIGDHVWIWHHTIIDGSCGVTIGKGSQIGAWVGIFSHSSHFAIRLLGVDYIKIAKENRPGYVRRSVEIGEYCFIGAGVKILPGVKLGKGCLVSADSVVTRSAADYSILAGNPAKVVGSTIDLDRRYLSDASLRESYFDRELIAKEFPVAPQTNDGCA